MYGLPISEVYSDARAKGKKAYNARKARGKSGHLTSLEGIIKDIEIMSTVDIGIREIQLKKIKGTNSNFRRMAFSKNFLPLEEPSSEFAGKWKVLCEAHLSDGIRDPIKVYEYMNFFYVIEGNKRVSVLSYYDASSIRAQILRLIPKYNEQDADVRLYYKFLDFYKLTNLNQIWLSQEEGYNRLAEALVDYHPKLSFYDDKYLHFFNFVFLPFRRLYKSSGGDKLNITTGDAFVLYARIYNIPQELDVLETKDLMPNLIQELLNADISDSSHIKTDALDLEKPSLINALSSLMGQKKMKIAFIYAKTIEDSGWSRSHEIGRQAVQESFKDNIETVSFEGIREDDQLKELIDELVKKGYHTIFTTAYVHRKATLSAALLYDQVKFFNCSGNRPYVHMSSYYGRSYEARFLTGLIAGSLTQTNVLGYTANSPFPETISCINAFALGAKMVNPHAKVKVSWTGVWNNPEENAKKIDKLIECGVDIISSKNNRLSRDATDEYGITSMLCTVDITQKKLDTYLAAPIWKWEVFYNKIITSLMNGSYSRIVRANREKQLVNFWWGLETGGIDVFMDEEILPVETVKLVKLMKRLIQSDQFKIFEGRVYDHTGALKLSEGELLSAEDILTMDWYADNVILTDI